MFKRAQAKFCRSSNNNYISVSLPGLGGTIELWEGLINLGCNVLGERELEQVVSILSREKETMLKQRNFPQIYEEMLTELIEVQRERYDSRVKKEKSRAFVYRVSIDELEEILGLYCAHKNMRISGIYVGTNENDLDQIDFDQNNRELFVQFSDANNADK